MPHDLPTLSLTRRSLLRSLAAVAAWALAPTAGAASDARATSPRPLSAAERRLAELGRVMAITDPHAARMLARYATRVGRSREGTRAAPAALLDPARRRRDVARGRVLSVDGWLLGRSEAAACAYLHYLSTARVA